MKLYIFDNNVLISGANLSESYFTDRADRYFLFKNCKQLADFFNEIIHTVGDTSFTVQSGQVIPSSNCDVHPYLGESQKYRELLKSRVEKVIQDYRENCQQISNGTTKTWIFPILQMGLLGINQELNLLNRLFSSRDEELKMTMASGYFNFTEHYEDLIFRHGTYEIDILTASPFANGFFESAGLSKYIPPLYSNISRDFLRKQHKNRRASIRMHEYFREGWTFHAKGLWIEKGNETTTLIGSSNYGYRSVHRDLEAQVLVITSDNELVTRLNQEKNRLFEHSSLLDAAALQKPEHYTPFLKQMAARFVRGFVNRNPRNNELMGRQAPNVGYQFEKDSSARSFIYRVELVEGKSHREGRLVHYKDGVVVSASTREPAIANQLYSKTDTSAALNIGRVLALRCLQSGIHFAMPGATKEAIAKSQHQTHFFKALEEEGLSLAEPRHVEHSYETDASFTWKRYPLKATRQDKLDEL
uniref:CDP-diacylglycerol--glycerol-3-phosphate 3-phosphatidyltransferase n=1 Tax=Caenorhabditis japonica TaxID=281687 RepID=A0A8R1DLP9_CAEJA